MQFLRLFVAIRLGDDLKRELATVEQNLQNAAQNRHASRSVRWVAPENIHLTIKFLGKVDPAHVPQVTTALRDSSSAFAPFSLQVKGLGCFPNTRRPSVIWAGLEGDVPRVVELANRFEDVFDALGFPRETRPFSPHLTLGRVRREAGRADHAAVGAIVESFPAQVYGVVAADAVNLMCSDLRPEGPIYSTMTSIPLNDSVSRPP